MSTPNATPTDAPSASPATAPPRAELRALAMSTPDRLLDNEHWRRHHPELVAQAEQKIWMWKRPSDWDDGARTFDETMEPYLADPFRGSRQRRVLPPDGTSLELEADAARRCLDAAGLAPEDVDLLICTSFLPDCHGIGGATHLARELGLGGEAWNLESACSSTLIAWQTASSLIESGLHEKILVVTSCTYSRAVREDDPIAWGIGDAATALLLGPLESRETRSRETRSRETPSPELPGLLGYHAVHSAETSEAVAYHLEVGDDGRPWLRMRTGRAAARLLRETSETYLLECARGAAEKAGLEIEEIDHFVFNTPLAWYADFCADALGVPREKTISTYPLYANVGPCLMGTNLLHAAHWNGIEPGDTVLVYTVGSVSSCAAAVVRWGEVALGELPEGASRELLDELASQEATPVTFSSRRRPAAATPRHLPPRAADDRRPVPAVA